MREIKFRIWCKQTEEMHTVERMGFEEGELWYVEDENRESEPPYFMDRNDSVLMQYTGLKDKNGREIYEGDILECTNEFNGIVFYEDGSFKLSSELQGIENYDVFDDLTRDLIIDNNLKIIGNIHENPELLGDSN